MTLYPNSALRTVALCTQGLDKPSSSPPTREAIYRTVDQIGSVQIDTLQMVRRSQYLVLWSRLGNYAPADLDALTSASDRRLFEGWQHAASIIPLTEYRYQLPRQRTYRERPSSNWYNGLLDENAPKDIVPEVLERIRREGALRVSDFESASRGGGAWWNWRPAKVALEILYTIGELMIADRIKFQRLYDLTERILPAWVDTREPTFEERDRFWVERGVKALGVCTPRQAGDYFDLKISKSRPVVTALLKEGVLIPVMGTLGDRSAAELIIHRDNLSLLEQAANGAIKAERTTFLSPFDNLWWAGQHDAIRRDEQFWNFRKSLEMYVPAPKRVHGYFCLSILHKDRLVGRFDPKLDRKTSTLHLKALYLEAGVKPDEEMVKDIASAMRDFMAFHAARNLVVEHSQAPDFASKLLQQI